MNRCPDLVVCLKRALQCLRPVASLVLIYRPNVAGMKDRVDIAQPVNRTPDLWCGSTIHYHSILFVQIEVVLNSRPICHLSNKPNDVQTLNPAHFLVGSSLVAVPDPDYTEIPMNRLSRFVWSDECPFSRQGTINTQNKHYWSVENHISYDRIAELRWSVNVWYGILKSPLIGLIYFDGSLTSESYTEILSGPLADFLEGEVSLRDLPRM
ncbi:uncharacterized protein TNCV_3045841 [Trichonephila clavipes]|uniref:Uncharacterized protein n=1 Tax=Trichonephila clavipes TaxID=2585209 RepID=A0A8X6V4Q1_TRICX|nr:uncharacterized protein TNCV_3045841 [Trichonephila clavipes]